MNLGEFWKIQESLCLIIFQNSPSLPLIWTALNPIFSKYFSADQEENFLNFSKVTLLFTLVVI